MSSLDRALTGDVMVFDLGAERAAVADPAILGRSGRNARTLLKEHGLHVTLVTVAAGGSIAEHSTDGPVSIQVLDGEVRVVAGGGEHLVKAGMLLSLAPGIPHGVTSEAGGTFLLTVRTTAAAG